MFVKRLGGVRGRRVFLPEMFLILVGFVIKDTKYFVLMVRKSALI